MAVRTEQKDAYLTVFDVWEGIYKKHPEITKQTAKGYSTRPHGLLVDQDVEVLPRERIELGLDERFFWGNPPLVKAIGAAVEVRPEDYDPQLDYSEWGRWTDGNFLKISPSEKRVIPLVDFESEPTDKFMDVCIGTLRGWREDWYLLDSGGSFHLVIAELILPTALPVCFGKLITDMAAEIGSVRSPLLGAIGGYLSKYWWDRERLKSWSEEVLDKFGHIDDPVKLGKLVFPVDMRYLAHVVGAISEGRDDEGFLRVSSKHGSVPVLKAQQVDGTVTVFRCPNDPFDRRQLRLDGI